MQSDIDNAVRKFRENKTHDWETVVVDGQANQYCKRCGKSKDVCSIPESPWWTLCIGFI